MATEMIIAVIAFAIIVPLLVYQLRGSGFLPLFKEKPEKILNKEVVLSGIDGLGKDFKKEITGIIKKYENSKYTMELFEPLEIDGKQISSLFVTSRHSGYPVSAAKKRGIIAVNCVSEDNIGFISEINLKRRPSI